MADDPQAPSEDTPDPETDSPAGDSTEDTAQDSPTPQQPDGTADKRVRDAQAALTRQATEFAEYRRTHPDVELDEGDEDEEGEPVQTRRRSSTTSAALEAERERADAAEWQLAEGIYGTEVIAAYTSSVDMLEQARTATDMVTAFEAYYEARVKGASPPQAASAAGAGVTQTQSREQAVTPRVETNRPDAAPDSDQSDPKRFEGGANGGVGGWLRERFGITDTS